LISGRVQRGSEMPAVGGGDVGTYKAGY